MNKPPHNNSHIESSRRAERRLLAKCFSDPVGSVTAIESSGLATAELQGDDHRHILDAILYCGREGRADVETVVWRLDNAGRLVDAGGRESMMALAREASDPEITSSPASALVADVRNLSTNRRTQETIARSLDELRTNPNADAASVGLFLAEELAQSSRRRVAIRGVSLRQGQFRNVAQDLAAEAARPEAMPEGVIPTGFPRLDVGLGGILKRGRTLLFLGPPDAGKTTLITQCVINAALYLKIVGEAVAEVFQEGTAKEWMRRATQLRAALKSGATPRAETLAQAGEELDACRLFIDDGEWNVDEITPHVARLKELGVALYVHESAEHLRALGADASDPLDDLEYKLRRIKSAARSNHVCTVLTASVNVSTVGEVLKVLKGRQKHADVAMVLLPQPEGNGSDPFLRELHVFHNHLGPLDRLSLRLRPDLGGILELANPSK